MGLGSAMDNGILSNAPCVIERPGGPWNSLSGGHVKEACPMLCQQLDNIDGDIDGQSSQLGRGVRVSAHPS